MHDKKEKILLLFVLATMIFSTAAVVPEIIIEKGDITQVYVEAIVNAANTQLAGGGGVCGAIFTAAGQDALQKECRRLGSCPVGQARKTSGCNLEKKGIKYIIHAVGPDCRIPDQNNQRDKLLYSAYKNALTVADENNSSSIAFPFISSAIFAFPKKEACVIALRAIRDYLKAHSATTSLKKVHIVLFSDEDFELFKKEAGSIKIPMFT